MKTASISGAKNRLSTLIDGLDGGAVVITDRGRPVARLERISDQDAPGAATAALVRAGLASPPRAASAAPGAQAAAQGDELAQMVGVVVGHQQRLAQQRLIGGVRQRGEQVALGIADQSDHRGQIVTD